jgi:hypothetical protein
MGLFGAAKFVLKYLAKGIMIFGGTAVCALLACQTLRLNTQMPTFLWQVAVGISIVCFFIGIGALVIAHNWQILKYASIPGIVAPAIIVGISFFLIPQFVVPSLSSIIFFLLNVGPIVSIIAFFLIVTLASDSSFDDKNQNPSRFPIKQDKLVGAIELTEIPDDYINGDESIKTSQFVEPFNNVLRTMMAAPATVGLRIERIQDRTRIYFLTTGNDSLNLQQNLIALESSLHGNFPNFKIERHRYFIPEQVGDQSKAVIAHLSGEPIRIDENNRKLDPLTVLGEPFHYYPNGIIQVFAKPRKHNPLTPLKQWLKQRKYRAKEAESKLTVAAPHKSFFSGKTEESATYVDMSKRDEAGNLYREILRIKAEYTCAVSFSIGYWGQSQLENERNAKLLANVMSGALVPADPAKEFTVKVSKSLSDFEKLVKGFPVGPESGLLPEEAVTYFILPRCDLGVNLTHRQAFSTSTAPLPESDSDSQVPTSPRYSEARNSSGIKCCQFNWLAK